MLKGFAQYQQIWCFGFIAKVLFFQLGVYVCAHVCMCECPQRPEKDIRSSEAGVTNGCEPPDMGAGTQALVLFTAGSPLQTLCFFVS